MRRVVVIGGGAAGFGGVRTLVTAFKDRAHVRLTLINQTTHHVIRSLLPEVAAGWTAPALSVVQLNSLRDLGPIDIVTERVTDIDVRGGSVTTDRAEYGFEYLLVALGKTARLPRGWGGHDHVQKFRTDKHAAELRLRIGRAFESNSRCSVAIVGGGTTGVDLAAMLADGIAGGLAPDVTLYEPSGQLLSRYPDGFSAYAAEVLEQLGVALRFGCDVAHPVSGGLELSDGTIARHDVVVWAGATHPATPLQKLDLPHHDSGVLATDCFLRLNGLPNAFAAGASVHLPHAPSYSMGVGFHGESGRVAARNLLAAMCGRAPERFAVDQRPVTVALGRHAAVAQVRGVIIKGRSAWGLHRVSLARAIPDWTNRLGVVGSWAQRLWDSYTS